ncbi:MAG: diaminopimelate epimerase [Candidatus Eisenbacteria bacterium]
MTKTPPHTGNARVVPFEKLDGAGNDFVLLRAPSPAPDTETIRRLLHRHHGIGGDGLLYLRTGDRLHADDAELDAAADYWNSDGGRAEYCGNGARCVAAVLLGERPEDAVVRFRLSDVLVRACRDGEPGSDRYAVAHPIPRRHDCPSEIVGLASTLGLLEPPTLFDSGVPHLVLVAEDARSFDLDRWAPIFRAHPSLGAAGANVDVVSVKPAEGRFYVRTFERGVEGETLACGSGLLAVGTHIRARDGVPSVALQSASGAVFRVWEEADDAFLSGPARRVFRGEVDLDATAGA